MLDSVTNRIEYIAKRENITITSLERLIGASKGVLSRAIANNTDIQSKWLSKIVENFQLYNANWLLTGQGSMIKAEDKAQVATLAEPDENGVPYYAIDFVGGFDFIYNSQKSNPDALIACPTIKGAQCWVDVSGKSMEPLITPGDIIALRQVTDYTNGILYGEIYAVVTDDFRTIKKIKRCSNAGYITLVPENPDYDPQDLAISNIRALYKVLGCTKKFF